MIIRRLAIGIVACVLAIEARAATCSTVAACTSAAPCDWSLPATWTCGHVPTRTLDTCVISANTTVMVRTDMLDCGAVTVNGTWLFDETPSGRDSNGYRRFIVGGNLTGNAGGTLRMRAGHKLAFATAAAPRMLKVNDGFVLDIQGQVEETTIAAFSDGPANPVDCGTGAPGREYVITPASGASLAHKLGRIVFQSGRARTRQMEIRAVSAGSIRVCTDTVDSASGSDTTGGQRLTPHADRNAFCTSSGNPASCCTGFRKGNCPTTPVSRHSEPAPYANSACTGPKIPYPCCTGTGAGACVGAIPAVGDRIAIVYDAWIYQSAGTNGYQIVGDLIVGNNPMPILKAVNIANAGTRSLINTSSVEFMAKAGLTTPDLEYINFHDYGPDIDGVRYYDIQNWTVRWSAFHDVTPNTQRDTQATLVALSWNLAADNVAFVDNVFYRTQGVGPHLNEAGFLPAHGCKFLRNLLFDSCLTGIQECGGMQADNCTGGEAAYNVLYDYYAGGGGPSIAFSLGMHGAGAAMHHNWVVNSGSGPQATSPEVLQIQGTGLTHNYVSHVVGDGGDGGSYFSNVIKNYGLAQPGLWSGIVNPIQAAGNYILGVESNIQSSPDCTGTNQCGRLGIRYVKTLSNSNQKPTSALDNIVVSLASYDAGFDGRCVEFDGYDLSGDGSIDANWNATVEHMTCDGRGPAFGIRGMSFDQRYASIVPPVTVVGRDLALLYNNDGYAVSCTTEPGVDEILENLYSLGTSVPMESGGDYALASDCTSAPAISRVTSMDYPGRTNGDYNLFPGSPNLFAGSVPPGSPIGARAFKFDRASLQSLWSTDPAVANDFCTGPGTPAACCTASRFGTCGESIITFDGEFPADVDNVDNRDTDGDGVLDLHDNSVEAFNPDQLDADGDRFGAVSDCNDLNAAVHPGAVEVCDGLDDDCDTLVDEGPGGVDLDRDGIPGACDNCPAVHNRSQSDFDADGMGDPCDLDDGIIYVMMPDRVLVGWQLETGYDSFNEYRGSLDVLRSQGLYTQNPLLVPSAVRNCRLTGSSVLDGPDPALGKVFFYLVSGNRFGIEGTLGTDSAGVERPNANPCPAP